jgi:uncharacterized protein
VKLIVREAESEALLELVDRFEVHVASTLARVEVLRAVRRTDRPEDLARAREILKRINLIHIGEPVLELACHLEPPTLRSLDAIHLATVLTLGEDIAGIATYDLRLGDAAKILDLLVFSPAS